MDQPTSTSPIFGFRQLMGMLTVNNMDLLKEAPKNKKVFPIDSPVIVDFPLEKIKNHLQQIQDKNRCQNQAILIISILPFLAWRNKKKIPWRSGSGKCSVQAAIHSWRRCSIHPATVSDRTTVALSIVVAVDEVTLDGSQIWNPVVDVRCIWSATASMFTL